MEVWPRLRGIRDAHGWWRAFCSAGSNCRGSACLELGGRLSCVEILAQNSASGWKVRECASRTSRRYEDLRVETWAIESAEVSSNRQALTREEVTRFRPVAWRVR